MRHLIIDGYNVIHVVPPLKNLLAHDPDSAREELIEDIARLTKRNKFRCTVVFDGSPPPTHPDIPNAPVHVRYSFPLKADDLIREMVEKSKKRDDLVIISSDREITDFARMCGCNTHSSRHFANMIRNDIDSPSEKPSSSLSPGQMKEWLRIFGEK